MSGRSAAGAAAGGYSVDLPGVASVTGSAASALDELRQGVSSTSRAIDAALVALAASPVSTTLHACSHERRAAGEGSVTLGGELLLAAHETVLIYLTADEEMAHRTSAQDAGATYDAARFGSGWSWN